MEQTPNDLNRYGGKGTPRIWSGLLLIIAGILLLAYKMGAPVPGWLFTWPMLLVALGLITGLKSNFRNPGALIMIVIGGLFLIDRTNPAFNFHNYIVPVILIVVGVIYVMRPKNSWHSRRGKRWHGRQYDSDMPMNSSPENTNKMDINNETEENAEYVEINAVLGGVKKIILSKNFKGGEITAFMGGTEINLLKADIRQPIVLEVNNIFGGTKLIVPANWDVKNEVTAVFGGIEDKRSINNALPDPGKTMVLKGTCVFGGIEVSNY
ncbi:MAG: LiaF domain-containing protein [Ginsengibacter sp.]